MRPDPGQSGYGILEAQAQEGTALSRSNKNEGGNRAERCLSSENPESEKAQLTCQEGHKAGSQNRGLS